MTKESLVKKPVWTPTKVQSLHRHQNAGYYAMTFAGGKEKWIILRTTNCLNEKDIIPAIPFESIRHRVLNKAVLAKLLPEGTE